MPRSETLEALNRRFHGACKILLKEEVGDVWEFDGWLEGMIEKNRLEKSCVSGKEVVLGIKEYARVKKLVLSEIAEKVTKNKKLEWSIYNIGALDVNRRSDGK